MTYEEQMLAMLKEPLGNVRVWHPSLGNSFNGASIKEVFDSGYRLGRSDEAWRARTHMHMRHENAIRLLKEIESAIAARGKV